MKCQVLSIFHSDLEKVPPDKIRDICAVPRCWTVSCPPAVLLEIVLFK
jgi:hypothetical protein